MNSEELSFATNILLENNALDVFITSIYMKKNRPAFLLTCLCKENEKNNLVKLIFKYTSTIGIRYKKINRYILKSSFKKVKTKFGEINLKKSEGYNIKKNKPEYSDLEKIAKENNISIKEIINEINKIYKT